MSMKKRANSVMRAVLVEVLAEAVVHTRRLHRPERVVWLGEDHLHLLHRASQLLEDPGGPGGDVDDLGPDGGEAEVGGQPMRRPSMPRPVAATKSGGVRRMEPGSRRSNAAMTCSRIAVSRTRAGQRTRLGEDVWQGRSAEYGVDAAEVGGDAQRSSTIAPCRRGAQAQPPRRRSRHRSILPGNSSVARRRR